MMIQDVHATLLLKRYVSAFMHSVSESPWHLVRDRCGCGYLVRDRCGCGHLVRDPSNRLIMGWHPTVVIRLLGQEDELAELEVLSHFQYFLTEDQIKCVDQMNSAFIKKANCEEVDKKGVASTTKECPKRGPRRP